MATKTIIKQLPNNVYISCSIILITISYCFAFPCTEDTPYCIQQCTDRVSCTNAIIDFSKATQGSLLTCEVPNTCINVTLICPDTPNTNIPCNKEPCPKNCEILGHGGIFESHSNWTIKAPNSWNDLTITDFNAYIEGTMYCNGDSNTNYTASCPIQYGLWNCEYDPSNKCFVQKENEHYINCTTKQQCKGDTNLFCPDIEEGENKGMCTVICSGNMSCSDAVINCGKRRQCNVLCTGEKACIGEATKTKINCGLSTLEECTVICGSPSTSGSCMNIAINADNYVDLRGGLNVNGMGLLAVQNSVIYGPGYADVDVQCNDDLSCADSTFYANNSVQLSIGCNGNEDACKDINVYCPTKTQNCFISGAAHDEQSDLQIFAIDGWNDIIISAQYKQNSIINTDEVSTNAMYCNLNGKYDASCLINSEWYCNCPPLPTEFPSISPTSVDEIKPSVQPTNAPDDGLSDREKNGYIVGGVFVGFVIACFIGVIYWYCCVHHKPVTKDKQYQSVESVDEKMDMKNDTEIVETSDKKGVNDEQENKQLEDNDDIHPL